MPLAEPSRQNLLVERTAGVAAGPNESVKLAQQEPAVQLSSLSQATLELVRFLRALALTLLIQVHTLATAGLPTLKVVPLNSIGAHTAAAVETAAPALLRLAQQ